MTVERGVVPGQAQLVNQPLEPGNPRLGDLGRPGLIGWVAETNKVWPYSWNRQHRPLIAQTGASRATSASTPA
jgi:hypothetical protein